MVQFKDVFSQYVGLTFPVQTRPQSSVKFDRPDSALEALRKEANRLNLKLYAEWPENNGCVPVLRDCLHVQVEKVSEDIYRIGDTLQYHSGLGHVQTL